MNARSLLVCLVLSWCCSLSQAQSDARPKTAADTLNQLWSRGRAVGKGPVKLKHFPLREVDIGSITPLGMMIHAHVTPSEHLSLQPKDRKAPKSHYPVVAPADGFIVDLQRTTAGNPDPGIRAYAGDYRIVIEHSSTVYSWFGLVDELDERVLEALDTPLRPGPPVSVRVPVKAGQVIARSGGSHGVDFTLLNTESVLKGFIDLKQFQHRDPQKPHVVDPFDYLEEPQKNRLLALNSRTAEPRGGRIDYDIDGRLVGNWYQQNSGGYAGANRRLDYWVGHLTFAYHHIDPTQIVVSLGDFDGKPKQFAVRGNAPDPAKVSANDGLVKYDLVYAPFNNNGDRIELAPQLRGVQGVLLAQLVEDRKLKIEVIPGKSAADVTTFTTGAKTYER